MRRCERIAWRWRVGVAVGLMGWVVGAAPARADELAEIRAKADQVSSYQAEFVLTVAEPEKSPTTLTGTIWYQRPDKRRIEFAAPQPSEEVAQLVVSDGAFEWQYFPSTKTVYKTEWAKVKAAGAPAEALELRGLHQPLIDAKPETIRLVETKTDGGQRLYVFEAEPAAALVTDAPFTPGTLRVEVNAEDGLTRRLSMTDAQGREVLSQRYTQVQTGVSVPPERFQFTVPEGTTVEDISDDRARATRAPAAGGK